jgi:hypothetical protein
MDSKKKYKLETITDTLQSTILLFTDITSSKIRKARPKVVFVCFQVWLTKVVFVLFSWHFKAIIYDWNEVYLKSSIVLNVLKEDT